MPSKILTSSLRHTKSEENLQGSEESGQINQQSFLTVNKQTPVKNPYQISPEIVFNFIDDDLEDCWSQEDDEITQQVNIKKFFS